MLTESTRTRGLVLFEPDEWGVMQTVPLVATVAIARCAKCETSTRVLPCDAVPYKTYGLGGASTNPNYVERQKSAVYFRP